MGESGCGKSTVARLLVGLYEPTRGGLTFDNQDAHAAFKGSDARAMRPPHSDDLPGPVRQPEPALAGRRHHCEPLREHGLITDKAELKARVGELLKSVGLSHSTWSSTPTSSPAASASVSPSPAPWLPSLNFWCATSLPVRSTWSVQAQVLNIMKDLQRERQLTYLFISHNLAVVRHVSDQSA